MKPDRGRKPRLSPPVTSAAIAKMLQSCWWVWKHHTGARSSWKCNYCSCTMPSGDEISWPAQIWVNTTKVELSRHHLLGNAPKRGNKSVARLHPTISWVLKQKPPPVVALVPHGNIRWKKANKHVLCANYFAERVCCKYEVQLAVSQELANASQLPKSASWTPG